MIIRFIKPLPVLHPSLCFTPRCASPLAVLHPYTVHFEAILKLEGQTVKLQLNVLGRHHVVVLG